MMIAATNGRADYSTSDNRRKILSTENVTVAELLALRAIVSVLLAEKIRDFKDEAAAAFELAASCSEIVNEAHLSGPDPEGSKQEALRHIDNIFGALKA